VQASTPSLEYVHPLVVLACMCVHGSEHVCGLVVGAVQAWNEAGGSEWSRAVTCVPVVVTDLLTAAIDPVTVRSRSSTKTARAHGAGCPLPFVCLI
jgi:hypothetical protein